MEMSMALARKMELAMWNARKLLTSSRRPLPEELAALCETLVVCNYALAIAIDEQMPERSTTSAK